MGVIILAIWASLSVTSSKASKAHSNNHIHPATLKCSGGGLLLVNACQKGTGERLNLTEGALQGCCLDGLGQVEKRHAALK